MLTKEGDTEMTDESITTDSHTTLHREAKSPGEGAGHSVAIGGEWTHIPVEPAEGYRAPEELTHIWYSTLLPAPSVGQNTYTEEWRAHSKPQNINNSAGKVGACLILTQVWRSHVSSPTGVVATRTVSWASDACTDTDCHPLTQAHLMMGPGSVGLGDRAA